MATHSSVLAWRIPETAEPGGLLSMGSHRVRHDWSDLAAAACPLSQWCYLTISSFATLFFCFNLSQHHSLFCWVSSLHPAARVLELELQHQSFQWIFRVDFFKDWLVWSPCCPRDSKGSSQAPQFESINSLALSLLYDPILTLHDYWKNHSFDYMDFCWQSDVSAF